MSFPKRFDTSRESEIYQQSIDAGYFKPEYFTEVKKKRNEKSSKSASNTFVVPMPPPNVTGVLHTGHALGATIQDVFCRYHRMKGKQVLFIPGTDHAGISTQVQVEKKLKKEQDLTRHDLGRVDFLRKVREFATEHRQIILHQFKKLGASCDRDREQFTLSESLSRAVRKSFKNLYDEWKIYLGYRIANRCKRCQTVLSDAEVEMEQTTSKLYQIRYFLIGWKNIHIDVYTTRPETIPADVALAVHPLDKRYKSIIWKSVMVPFVNRKIPVISDESVDMHFGSWVLKITPAHDATDFEIGTKHNLPLDVFAIDKQGRWTGAVPEFAGCEVEKFFDTYKERLKEIGNLIGVEEYENSTPHCERCATKIEPLASEQWFVDVKEYAQRTLEVIDNGTVSVFPDRFKVMFHQRLDTVKPRCISRQLWRWHRIPIRSNDNGDLIAVDEDYIYNQYKHTISHKPTAKGWAVVQSHIILSQIIFNLIADNKLEEKFEFQDLLDVLLRKCLVSHDGLIYELYLRTYRIKYQQDRELQKQIEELAKLFDKLKEGTNMEDTLDSLLDIIKQSFGLKQQRQFIMWDREWISWYKNLKQHWDVLDTWFSSGLWAFSTLGRPEKTTDFEQFFPMSFLDTANDILFPWVCRMMMMSYANTGKFAFENLYFHGLVRDEKWAKMSKSKGNGIDPLDIIAKYGADALRLSLIANNPPGNDLNFSESKAEYFSRFVTKLRNASRYVWINAIGDSGSDYKEQRTSTESTKNSVPKITEPTLTIDLDVLKEYIIENKDLLNDFDIWILNGLDDLLLQTEKQFENYNLSQSVEELVKFTWNNFCDWYIEIAKTQQHALTEKVMLYIVGVLLKLLHPVAPFVTQALYHDIGFGDWLCVQSYPTKLWIGTINTQTKLFIELISEFRNLKNEIGIKSNEKITALIKANTSISNMIKQYETMFCKIVMCDELVLLPVNQDVPADFATKLVFDITIGIRTITPVDLKTQIKKLEEQLIVENNFISDLQSLLISDWFVKSAPKPIRDAKQAKLDEVKLKVQSIELELQRLKYLGG